MEGENRNRRMVLQTQAKEIIFHVYRYFRKEADVGRPLIDVARVQERTANACGVSIKTVQRIISENRKRAENSDNINLSVTDIGETEKKNLEEPHTVFIAVPDAEIKKEIFEEELPDPLSDEDQNTGHTTSLMKFPDNVSTAKICDHLEIMEENLMTENVEIENVKIENVKIENVKIENVNT